LAKAAARQVPAQTPGPKPRRREGWASCPRNSLSPGLLGSKQECIRLTTDKVPISKSIYGCGAWTGLACDGLTHDAERRADMDWSRDDFVRRSISDLTYEIHDMYFRLDRMRYDEAAGVWSLPIGAADQGPYDTHLIVSGVTACRVRDTEQIGVYDIHSMQLDAVHDVLRLKCNVPLEISLSVSREFTVRTARDFRAADTQ